jgi:hypothetical protein
MHIPVRWQFIATLSEQSLAATHVSTRCLAEATHRRPQKEANQKIGWGGTYGLVSQNGTAIGLSCYLLIPATYSGLWASWCESGKR